jgi:hypothetical protein
LALFTATFSLACSSGDGEDKSKENVDPDIKDPGSVIPKGYADPCKNVLDTGFANDDICLEPPAEDVGFQIHYGPSDYSDPADIEKYRLAAGAGDYVRCYFSETSNDTLRYSDEYHTRARKGTHHVIMWMGVTEDAERGPIGEFAPSCRLMSGQVFFPGTQAGIGDKGARLDVPVNGIRPEENVGQARKILPHSPVSIETHYVNITDEAMLAEVWMNMIYMPEKEVTGLIDPIFLIGGINANVAYGVRDIYGVDQAPPPIPEGEDELRIMGFAAHAHAHTSRVTAWINRVGATEREYVYETYDWENPLNAQFDTVTKHKPVEHMGAGVDAAYSGILTMQRGDTFGWECDVENDDLPNKRLTFGDGAYEKEMCNIFGFFAPGSGRGQWLPGGTPYIRKAGPGE